MILRIDLTCELDGKNYIEIPFEEVNFEDPNCGTLKDGFITFIKKEDESIMINNDKIITVRTIKEDKC